jgi:hypothetical protein
MAADVGEHDGRAAHPRTFADSHPASGTGLFSNGPIEIRDAMRGGAARDVHPRPKQDISFEVDETQMASWPDVHVRVDPSPGLAEERPELDGR